MTQAVETSEPQTTRKEAPRLCEWVAKPLALRMCVAEACPGDCYCSAHRAIANGDQPLPKPDRREYRDTDLLPYTDEEFGQLADLHERSTKR